MITQRVHPLTAVNEHRGPTLPVGTSSGLKLRPSDASEHVRYRLHERDASANDNRNGKARDSS